MVDGRSSDRTMEFAGPLADTVISAPRGRAAQMNAGAESARHDILLFLHADTQLPANADALITAALQAPGQIWGRFDLRFSGTRMTLRLLERFTTWRSLVTGMARGTQALFVERTWFERVGGYDPVIAGEDTALSRKLKRHSWPARIVQPVVNAGRQRERGDA